MIEVVLWVTGINPYPPWQLSIWDVDSEVLIWNKWKMCLAQNIFIWITFSQFYSLLKAGQKLTQGKITPSWSIHTWATNPMTPSNKHGSVNSMMSGSSFWSWFHAGIRGNQRVKYFILNKINIKYQRTKSPTMEPWESVSDNFDYNTAFNPRTQETEIFRYFCEFKN